MSKSKRAVKQVSTGSQMTNQIINMDILQQLSLPQIEYGGKDMPILEN